MISSSELPLKFVNTLKPFGGKKDDMIGELPLKFVNTLKQYNLCL